MSTNELQFGRQNFGTDGAIECKNLRNGFSCKVWPHANAIRLQMIFTVFV